MGLKAYIGSPRDLISSSERMKYALWPVARPRLIWKKSEMVAIPDRLLTPAAGKRVLFDSWARARAGTARESLGSNSVPPKGKGSLPNQDRILPRGRDYSRWGAPRYPVKGSDAVDRAFPKYVAPGEPEPGTGK